MKKEDENLLKRLLSFIVDLAADGGEVKHIIINNDVTQPICFNGLNTRFLTGYQTLIIETFRPPKKEEVKAPIKTKKQLLKEANEIISNSSPKMFINKNDVDKWLREYNEIINK